MEQDSLWIHFQIFYALYVLYVYAQATILILQYIKFLRNEKIPLEKRKIKDFRFEKPVSVFKIGLKVWKPGKIQSYIGFHIRCASISCSSFEETFIQKVSVAAKSCFKYSRQIKFNAKTVPYARRLFIILRSFFVFKSIKIERPNNFGRQVSDQGSPASLFKICSVVWIMVKI